MRAADIGFSGAVPSVAALLAIDSQKPFCNANVYRQNLFGRKGEAKTWVHLS
jgi:hypothetical protein